MELSVCEKAFNIYEKFKYIKNAIDFYEKIKSIDKDESGDSIDFYVLDGKGNLNELKLPKKVFDEVEFQKYLLTTRVFAIELKKKLLDL
jgi:hypothetical protein